MMCRDQHFCGAVGVCIIYTIMVQKKAVIKLLYLACNNICVYICFCTYFKGFILINLLLTAVNTVLTAKFLAKQIGLDILYLKIHSIKCTRQHGKLVLSQFINNDWKCEFTTNNDHNNKLAVCCLTNGRLIIMIPSFSQYGGLTQYYIIFMLTFKRLN